MTERESQERAAFEEVLKADPYDLSTHRVYADWLSERGLDDEAAFHARWTPKVQQSVEWITEWGQEIKDDYDEDSRYYYKGIPYEQLMKAAHAYLDGGDYLSLPFQTPDTCYDKAEEFWKHFEIVTGRKIEDTGKFPNFFSCAC